MRWRTVLFMILPLLSGCFAWDLYEQPRPAVEKADSLRRSRRIRDLEDRVADLEKRLAEAEVFRPKPVKRPDRSEALKPENPSSPPPRWIVEAPPGKIEDLIRDLGDRDKGTRVLAVDDLVQLSGAAVPSLLEALEGGSDLVAQGAACALSRIGAPALAPVVDRASNQTGKVQLRARRAVSMMEDSQARDGLCALLKDGPGGFRAAAAQALGSQDHDSVVEALLEALMDPDLRVQRAAALSLGKLGDVRALEPLTRLLKSSAIKDTAARVMAAIGRDRVVSNLRRIWKKTPRTWIALALVEVTLDEEALTYLLTRSERLPYEQTRRIVDALEQAGGAKALNGLLHFIEHGSWRERRDAVFALQALNDSRVIEPLIELLRNQLWPVRSTAWELLRSLTGNRFGHEYEIWKKWFVVRGE